MSEDLKRDECYDSYWLCEDYDCPYYEECRGVDKF